MIFIDFLKIIFLLNQNAIKMNLDALVCEYDGCKMIFENPVTLPCGRSLCRQHLDKFDEKFNCYFCDKEHQIPSTNVSMTKMIDYCIQFDPLRKKIKDSFDNLNESIKEYEDIESDVYIHSYFFEIRNKVDLHREELKNEIDERSEAIIQQLKEKEEKCKLNAQKLQKLSLDEWKNKTLPILK